MRAHLTFQNKIVVAALIILVGIAGVTFAFARNGNQSNLTISFLDIGQGDAIFIQTPDGRQVLIDGGPDNKIIEQLSKVMPFQDRDIDMVVLTHPDADHIAGLIEVLRRYEVANILETGMACGSSFCDAWGKAVDEESANHVYAHGGQRIYLEEGTGIEILYPFVSVAGQKFSKRNNQGIVAKLIFPQGSLLLTADIEKIVEEKLRFANIDVSSTILKVPHHGSKSSSTEIFLKNVSPVLAFIQAGIKNRYGHPHREVLDRLEKLGIKYYSTKDFGRITLTVDDNKWEIETEKKSSNF